MDRPDGRTKRKCVCRDIIAASPIISAAVEKGEIAVAGMFYDLASGAARVL
jgi:carbonic anhydrase